MLRLDFVLPHAPIGRTTDADGSEESWCCHTRQVKRHTVAPVDDMLSCVIVWKDRPSAVKPVEERKRLRDLRPGDRVTVFGKLATLVEVEIYR
jgi:hypothetical protein